MMDGLLPALAGALWLGILTSISPCPLATNIAAISFVSKRVSRPVVAVIAGFLYALGRTLVYVALAMILVTSLVATPAVSRFLQTHMNEILGPILILVGMFLLELLRWPIRGGGRLGQFAQDRASNWGPFGAVLLGMLFALSFCPVSAALFFGSLLPLAVERQSTILLPGVYGLGTALPVMVFGILVASGTRLLGRLFDRITTFEKWARRVTGVVFVIAGVYYVVVYILI